MDKYNRRFAYPFSTVEDMAERFGFKQGELTEEKLEYRMSLLKEEFDETQKAYDEKNPEDFVDGNIDIIVIAMGNLAICNVDGRRAFDVVMEANFKKEIGKRSEDDPDGMSIRKPEGWKRPDHSDNIGDLETLWVKDGNNPEQGVIL